MDAEPTDDLPLIRCAVYTRQSVVRAGDDPALASCAVQRTLCTEFIRSMAWRGWYPIGEHFDDEGYSGATIERPGLERLIARIQDGDVQRVIVYLAEQQDLEVVRLLLAATWFPSAELDEQLGGGRRLCVVLELGGVIIGAAVLDEHGDVGVLRALSIDPPYRRRRHGTALAAFVIRLAYEHGLGSVYAAAASQWFLEEVGFQHIERVLLPRAALHLPSLAKVPAAAYIFEITPSVNGTRTPRRMVPRTLSELLAQPDRVPADTTGPRARRKRQQVTEDKRDDAPTTR